MNEMYEAMNTKSAFVAIIGKPNAGKSSLMNLLIGEKIAITSDKPQTTRTRITGVLTEEETQLVFIDTPGLHKAKNKLGEYMVKQVGDSVADVDIAILVVEPKGEITQPERDLIERFKALRLPAILCINKIDTLENKEEMLAKIAMLSKEYTFDEVIPISALKKDGINILTDELEKYAEEGPHYFADDSITDQPERAIVAEIIREKALTEEEYADYVSTFADETLNNKENGFESKEKFIDKIIASHGNILNCASISLNSMEYIEN